VNLDAPFGLLLYCRRCDEVRPHAADQETNSLRCPDGHGQSPVQAVVSLSCDSEFDPAVLLLPQKSWTYNYVLSRYRLQGQYLRRRGSS
jgi:hypothetical protein